MANDTMYSSHTMCVNSCAKTFMSFCMPTDFVKDVSHLRIKSFVNYIFLTPLVLSYQDWMVYVFR